MNAKTLIPLTAAALFAVCTSSMLIASHSYAANAATHAAAEASTHIVDLPAVTVRPAAEDLVYFQANKIVDLAAVTVRPAAEDLAAYVASQTLEIVDLPAVTVRPEVEDMKTLIGVATLASQIAR